MKTVKLLLTTCMVFGVAACNPRGQTIVEKHYVTSPSPTNPPIQPDIAQQAGQRTDLGNSYGQAEGGIDGGGGGNGVNKKSLESWKVDLTKLPAFERLNEKVISKLKARFPKLAADIMHIAEERSWYIIPVELKTLPAAKIGVSFRIEQIALQKLKEIWINDLIYATMEPLDQEILILHELLMGVRLLQFTNRLDQCLVNIAVLKMTPGNDKKYTGSRKDCYAKNRRAAELGDNLGFGQAIKLDNSDYEETIRPLTNLLFEKIDTFDPQELEDWMVIRKFRSYSN